MKKRIFLCLLASILACVLVAGSDFYSVSYNCTETLCVPGHKLDMFITINNSGRRTVYLKSIRFVDNFTQMNFGLINFTDWEKVENTRSYKSEVKLPATQKNNIFLYEVCISQKVPLETWGDIGKTVDFCYPKLHNITFSDCFTDHDCSEDANCINNSCIGFGCGYCQYAQDHRCNDYECCIDEECALNMKCIEHTCSEYQCASGSFPINHSCDVCTKNETMEDYSCKRLDCEEDELMTNSTCIKLDCFWNETAIDHRCIALNCSEDEQIIEHKCKSPICNDDQALKNNLCYDLNCTFPFKAEDHECLIDSNLIIQLIILAMMVYFASLSLKKYRLKQRSKTFDQLWSKAKNRKNKKDSIQDKK